MSILFKSYEEKVESKNGKISKMTKTTTHNGKKGVEIMTKNGKTKRRTFKVNSRSLPKIKNTTIVPSSILVSVPMHQVMSEGSKRKNGKSKKSLRNVVKSKKFKKYARSKSVLRKKKSKKRRKSKKTKTRKIKKSKSLWNKLIGM